MAQQTANTEQENMDLSEQYLTFTIDDEAYGVDILRVQEIKGWEEVRAIPNTPDHVKGVLNLRGTIVPVVDLRIRFDVASVAYLPTTVIIVLAIEKESQQHITGFVVDGVSDVLDIKQQDIKSSPDFGSRVDTKFISNMVVRDDQLVILLDTDKLLNMDELAMLEGLK